MRSFPSIVCLSFIIPAVCASLAQAHEEEVIVVGRSVAGEIKVDSDFAQPVELPVSIFPGISGYATGELGVHSTVFDDLTNDFFQLSTAGDFRFILLAKDPGMEVWNDTGSGYMNVGESFFVGQSPFDTHPIWNIVNGRPGNAYSLTLKFHDLNGIYTDSAPFVVSFTPPSHFEINVTQVDPLHATLSWTTNASSWSLESTASLGIPNWNVITNAPSIVGTNFVLNVTTTNAQEFFRLHKQ